MATSASMAFSSNSVYDLSISTRKSSKASGIHKAKSILKILSAQYESIEHHQKAILQMFPKVQINGFSPVEYYAGVAIKAVEQLILLNFSMDEESIRTELDQTINDYVNKYHYDEVVRMCVTYYFLQYATLAAVAFEKPEFINILVDISKKSPLCSRLPYIEFTVPGTKVNRKSHLKIKESEMALLFPEKSELIVYTRSFADIYLAPSLGEIRNIFFDNEKFNMGLIKLEQALATKWKISTSLPEHIFDNQLKLFELAIPSLDAFLWWKNLPLEMRKMHGVFHEVLRQFEHCEKKPVSELDTVARFWGFVPNEIANQILRDGYRYAESSLSLSGVLHGVNAHRIQLAVIKILIDEQVLYLPHQMDMSDLLCTIADTDNWGGLMDNTMGWFGAPQYLMSYLRNAEHLPTLRQYAVFSFFNSINKLMQLKNIPVHEYESLIYSQLCHGHYFSNAAPDEAVITKITSRTDIRETTFGPRHFFYYKKNKATETAHDTPELVR